MCLFDKGIELFDGDKKDRSESDYSYLNRSSRSKHVNIRSELEKWFNNYPTEHSSSILSPFRSKDNIQHKSAFFELFIHELLLKLGCLIECIHPKVDGKQTQPDFLVKSKNGELFYLEATVCFGEKEEQQKRNNLVNDLYDRLDRKINSPDYFLVIHLTESSKMLPKMSDLAGLINKSLNNLNYEDIVEKHKESETYLELFQYRKNDWDILFGVIPKLQYRGCKGIKPIGIEFIPRHIVKNREAIYKKLDKKAGKYGKMKYPYIIALNLVCPDEPEDDDIHGALFGEEIVGINRLKNNGLWCFKNGKMSNSRVSGVLISTSLRPDNLKNNKIRLYHNPWAEKKYSSELTSLNHIIVKEEKIINKDGRSLLEVFGLPEKWPWS